MDERGGILSADLDFFFFNFFIENNRLDLLTELLLHKSEPMLTCF